jgi:hypothetical protein
MPAFEAGVDGRMVLSLPGTDFPELSEASEAYQRILQERTVTQKRLTSLQRDREAAIEKDRVALAKAIAAGDPDPQDGKVVKVEKEIAACERRLQALEIALDDAEAHLIVTVDDNRAAWVEQARSSLEDELYAYTQSVEALAASRFEVALASSLLAWLSGFPETESSFRPRAQFVAHLPGPHSDPYLFADVIEALRKDAETTPRTFPVQKTEAQARHEERLANELAGKGYFTDGQLREMAENPEAFWGGTGAKVGPGIPIPGVTAADTEEPGEERLALEEKGAVAAAEKAAMRKAAVESEPAPKKPTGKAAPVRRRKVKSDA